MCIALVVQHAKRMRRIILSVTCPAIPYLSTIFHNGTIFGKKATEYKTRFLIFCRNLCKRFPILIRIQRDIVINVKTSSFKVNVILVIIYLKPEFSWEIFEKSSDTKFHQNSFSGIQLVSCRRRDGRTEGQTRDEVNIRCSQFCECAYKRWRINQRRMEESNRGQEDLEARHWTGQGPIWAVAPLKKIL